MLKTAVPPWPLRAGSKSKFPDLHVKLSSFRGEETQAGADSQHKLPGFTTAHPQQRIEMFYLGVNCPFKSQQGYYVSDHSHIFAVTFDTTQNT